MKAKAVQTFMLHEVIQHGPIIFADKGVKLATAVITSHVVLPDDIKTKFDALFADQKEKPRFIAKTVLHFSGSVDNHLLIPAFHYKSAMGDLHWQGFRGHWDIGSHLDRRGGHFSLKGIQFGAKDQRHMQLGQLELRFHLTKTKEGVWVGKGDFDFPLFTIGKADDALLSVSGIHIASHREVKQQLLHSTMTMKLKNAIVTGTTYGPGEFNLAVRNIDAVALEKVTQQVRKASNVNLSPQARRAQNNVSIAPIFPYAYQRC